MKRINEHMTRRQMKQVKINIDPDIAEDYKLLCKEIGSSINIELEKYITNQVNQWKETQKKKAIKLSYNEAMASLEDDPLYIESKKAINNYGKSKVIKYTDSDTEANDDK